MDNLTFNYGGFDGVINTAMEGEGNFGGYWLFIRFKYQKCDYVYSFVFFSKLDWVNEGPTGWVQGVIGEVDELSAFTDSGMVEKYMKANID